MPLPTSSPTLCPAQAARQLVLTPALLHATRQQAVSAALLASMLASAEQQQIISRAHQALDEPLSLAEHVRLIGRLYHHAAAVYATRPDKPPPLHGDEPRHLVLEARRDYLYQVSHAVAAA